VPYRVSDTYLIRIPPLIRLRYVPIEYPIFIYFWKYSICDLICIRRVGYGPAQQEANAPLPQCPDAAMPRMAAHALPPTQEMPHRSLAAGDKPQPPCAASVQEIRQSSLVVTPAPSSRLLRRRCATARRPPATSLHPLCAINRPLILLSRCAREHPPVHYGRGLLLRCREEDDSALSTAAKLASADVPRVHSFFILDVVYFCNCCTKLIINDYSNFTLSQF
jgi:hypothetical protein